MYTFMSVHALFLVWLLLHSPLQALASDFSLPVFGNRSISLPESLWPLQDPFIVGDTSINNIFSRSHGLLKRQTQCVDAGYVPCSNLPNYCCPAGEDCFVQGCCEAGYQPCGGRCYDPSIATCCSEGYVCQGGYDCVGNNYCCPRGKKRCGSRNCYDPESEKCCSDGSSCPSSYDCIGDGFCCPVGEQRCGNSKCYNPQTATCCTGGGQVWACEANEKCCADGGATACYNPTSEQCCPGGSCDKDYACCGKECCPSSSTCGGDGYCTRKPGPTTPISPGPTGESNKPAPANQKIVFKYDPNRKVKGADGKLYDAQNRAILENMCEGIKNFLGAVAQEIELTRVDEATRNSNRKTMCPKGWCAKALKSYLKKYYPNGLPEEAQQAVLMAKDLQCDEFPFAISAEGGDLSVGTRICLPGPENSWQGGVMSNFFKGDDAIAVGDKFTVQIDGFDCETMMPEFSIGSQRRDDVNVTNITGDSLYSGYDPSDSNQKLLAMPLGDLDAGSYSVQLSVASGNLQFKIVTYDGTEIDADRSGDGNTITFNLAEAQDAVSLVGTTTDANVQVSYQSKKVDEASSATTSIQPLSAPLLLVMLVGSLACTLVF